MRARSTTTGTWRRRASCSARKWTPARKATRVQARASQPSRRTSGAYLSKHVQVPRVHDDNAQAHRSRTSHERILRRRKANTTERWATLLATSLSMTSRDKSRLLPSTTVQSVGEEGDSAASRVTAFSTYAGGSCDTQCVGIRCKADVELTPIFCRHGGTCDGRASFHPDPRTIHDVQ